MTVSQCTIGTFASCTSGLAKTSELGSESRHSNNAAMRVTSVAKPSGVVGRPEIQTRTCPSNRSLLTAMGLHSTARATGRSDD